MMKKSVLFLTQGAMIAAIYVVATYFINVIGLANGAIQIRASEALCILPVFTPAAIPGLFVGCFLSNVINGCVIWDIIFGSLATLIGAVGTYLLRDTKFVYTLPPVISNACIIPFVLKYAYGIGDAIWLLAVTVGIGEVISVCILGSVLRKALSRYKDVLFKEAAYERTH